MTAALETGPGSPSPLSVALDGADSISTTLSQVDLEHAVENEVHIDLHRLAAVGSVELAALIRFCVRARSAEKRVVFTNVAPVLCEVFEVTRFGRLAEIQPASEASLSTPHRAWLFGLRGAQTGDG